MGAMAMDFILTFDELVLQSIGSLTTRLIMSRLEPYAMPSRVPCSALVTPFMLAIPRKLIFTLGMCVFFMWRYYHINCSVAPDGSVVSNPLYMPNSTFFSMYN